VALRNFLAHGYASIDHNVVWRAQWQSLPILRAEVETLLRELEPPPGPKETK